MHAILRIELLYLQIILIDVAFVGDDTGPNHEYPIGQRSWEAVPAVNFGARDAVLSRSTNA